MRDFLLMFFIVFCATGQAFNMAFGTHLLHYSTSASSMMTLFRALLGDFEYLLRAIFMSTWGFYPPFFDRYGPFFRVLVPVS